ncbi:MAG TPA: amino acid ABC transporter permease [Beijerinckiaceae bacterium]|nr:amino acid ABC transporter permease [Beijerinckiaceae bacterium]
MTRLAVLLPPAPPDLPGGARPDAFGTVRLVLAPRLVAALVAALALSTVAAEAANAAGRPGVLELLAKWFPLVFSGFLFNLLVSVLAMTFGTLLGVMLGLAQVSLLRPLRRASWFVTQFFRNAPWLVLLFYAMLILPFELRLGGLVIAFPAWLKAVIGLSLPVMANISEIVRGGVQSIPAGQWESAESLAFTRRQTLWMIILPQAVKRMLPPWMNQYAILTMATTLISVVGVQDALTMTRGALVAEARTDLLIPMYLMLLAMFFVYCYPIARATLALERRFAVKI